MIRLKLKNSSTNVDVISVINISDDWFSLTYKKGFVTYRTNLAATDKDHAVERLKDFIDVKNTGEEK